jgi:DNA-directed RNA polymerase III subunit RPC1
MTTQGIRGITRTSNHIVDVEKVLGIEAALATIIKKISVVYDSYSLALDRRHLGLSADIMMIKGSIHGINRHGLAKTSTSSLKLVREPVLSPGRLLMPQNRSVLRDQIQARTFDPLARR